MHQLVQGYVGDSEKAIADMFAQAKKAKPAILFIDEIESLFGDRDQNDLFLKVYSQLVFELDRLEPRDQVVLMAATNLIDAIDPGLLRSGLWY